MRRELVIGATGLVILFVGVHVVTPHMALRVSHAIKPSAAKALALGQDHFSSHNPRMYDIEKASVFFEEAYRRDANLPEVNHELARMAFLRSDFETAMKYIDRELELYGETSPSSYYVRGLIEGYYGFYDAAVRDYTRYLEHDPNNWAGVNDLAWVLLKAHRALEAAHVTGEALNQFPDNAWLLNSNATALFEIGEMKQALIKARASVVAAESVTAKEWLVAYPGNDPKIAEAGVQALRKSAINNVQTIEKAIAEAEVE